MEMGAFAFRTSQQRLHGLIKPATASRARIFAWP
uniref:Uncharacterized protein n=1 Tax=Macrostomum lignano TaxID=282301 RepID=A0A1I8FCG5_9PLAT